jgi:hypothetical protein
MAVAGECARLARARHATTTAAAAAAAANAQSPMTKRPVDKRNEGDEMQHREGRTSTIENYCLPKQILKLRFVA